MKKTTSLLPDNAASRTNANEFWLPDFCSWAFSLRIAVVCVVISLFLLLAQTPTLWPFPFWDYALLLVLTGSVLGTSFFVICRLRQHMMAWRHLFVAISVVAIIMCNLLWLSIGGFMLLDVLGLPMLSFVSSESSAIFRHLLMSGLFAGLFMRYLTLQAQLRSREKAALEARLEALQARIEPHFLFNSMNIIASLISIDPEKAEQVVEDLAALFRASLKDTSDVSLAEEIALCRRYANIEELRIGERLQIEWQLPNDIHTVRIPLLTLQPLLENAIRHGAEMSATPCKITLAVQISADWVRIRLTNPLPATPARPGNQMSMRNILLRLQARFGSDAQLEAAPEAGYFVTELSYPRRGA